MDRAPEYRPESSMSDSRNITRRGDAFAADLCRLRARRWIDVSRVVVEQPC
jgi:hypothetical protein